MNEVALDALQALRDRLGKPMIVRSANHSPEHNRAVGGVPRSKHMDRTAIDITMSNHDPASRLRRTCWPRQRARSCPWCPISTPSAGCYSVLRLIGHIQFRSEGMWPPEMGADAPAWGAGGRMPGPRAARAR